MRKFLILFLLLSMLLTLVACGETTTTTTTASEAEVTELTEVISTEEAADPTETAPAEEGENPTGVFGTINGNVYENEYLGLGCDLDDDWYIYKESELASLLGLTADALSDSNLSDLIEQSGTAFLFYAIKQDGTSANITIENKNMYSAFLTDETYVELVIPTLENALPAAGFENMTLTAGKIEFLGEEKPCVYIEAEISGTPIYEILVPIIKGDYIATATVCTLTANNCAEILSEFYLIAK